MELKEYQQRTLKEIRGYLESLYKWSVKNQQVIKAAGSDATLDFPLKAWAETVKTSYRSRQNGLGHYLPNFCLKIPTGGGKTLLAVKTIDIINTVYRKKQTGLVLWVVPSNQIYNQTLKSLRNREHPYRQHLDIASGGRTSIIEKMDRFTPLDIKENLVILLLMLPSASRQNKETLKVFKDNGGFQNFFPSEDDVEGNKKLLEAFPNLDTFGKDNSFFGRQVKTSLGNTLRILSPIIILDEGHKAYSDTAQKTLRGFNPSIIIELSATPNKESNILVDIKGVELAREEMIKLDLHVINKASLDWKDTMLASIEKRNLLEEKTKDYLGFTGEYIRPICLIQVERTGKDQRSGRFIHAEDVFDYLEKVCGIPKEQIAIKTSEKDDIEGINLLSPSCPIRYIITKQALQEGWDCSFAYVLTILTNPSSKNNLTQLVGRILRQPFARKTKIQDLDESYVVCFQQKSTLVLKSIKEGFEDEGLGDLTGMIISDSSESGTPLEGDRIVNIRDDFKKLAGQIFLPVFVLKDFKTWRKVSYESDIVSLIDWDKADFSPLYKLPLSYIEDRDIEIAVGLSDDDDEVIQKHGTRKLKEGGLTLDLVFITRHLTDIIPNPWVSFEIVQKIFKEIIKRNDAKKVINNLVFLIEELRKHAESEKDRLSQEIFINLIAKKEMRFLILRESGDYRLPSKIKVKRSSKTLTQKDGQPLQYSLFDFVPEENFNDAEKDVAWYLEDQERLLWWYRNISRQDYSIQGWKRHKVYPDFIFSDVRNREKVEYDKVFVVETKGIHLKNNDDSNYKKDLFAWCNKLAEEKSWTELGLSFPEKKIIFEVISEDEWQKKINQIFLAK